MAKKNTNSRRLKGYYGFSKKYPSRRGEGYAIGESRKMKKKERRAKIFFAVFCISLFAAVFTAVMLCYQLSTRPIPIAEEKSPVVTSDNIGTVRAIYIDNETLGDMNLLSKFLDGAVKNGFNAVIADFKTREGYLAYESDMSGNYGNGGLNLIDSVTVNMIKSKDLMLIAGVYCFEDSIAPQRLNAYVYENAERTQIWFDASAVSGGKVWLNPALPQSADYICSCLSEVVKLGADAVYLQSVQFPASREGVGQFFTEDDTTLNRNAVLLDFIERAVKTAGERPVIIAVPLEGAEGGNEQLWGGTLFDTAASVCSPMIAEPDSGDYIKYVGDKYVVMNENVKNNFSTIKVIPTVNNNPDDPDFYEKMAQSSAESYIIIP